MMPSGDGQFPTTSWTLIGRIKSGDETVAARALEDLCGQYHYPLYCYLRRRGCAHHDAQDLLHDFLVLLFRRHDLERLEEERGRLRGYLCTALGRHVHQWRRSEARRSGAGPAGEEEALIERTLGAALDFDSIAERYRGERFTEADTPDRVFERKWALELLQTAIGQLAARYDERGRGRLFAVLRPVLEAGGSLRGEDTPALAAAAGLREDALRAALARLLREFRETMQAAVRLTVEEAGEVEGELAYLTGLFRR